MHSEQASTPHRISRLKAAIRSAFAGAVPPSRAAIAPHECEECEAVRVAFDGKAWYSLDASFLEENYDKLPLLGATALPAYLAAYLLYALDNLNADDIVTEFTIYHLAPNRTASSPDYYHERLSALTAEQFATIEAFTQLALEDEAIRTYFGGLGDGRVHLRELWESRWA